ncbi:MAG: selenocysteine-specific translation elongation factor [Myxococcales bacterium]|nr:selenocysteine-specific translation elongation factor [Myxococcales bacterium]MCB9644496.1 selenocysteine-specific translation elongation factor [Myxococcales bacterium]
MIHRILGTAGHIDHGKSRLVYALSGHDPDRLPEEKRRGITIDLGFASLQTHDVQVGLVDVPGHEGLIRTMVAGASGMDFVMLVIAADEGIMPQTREHLAICRFLGIRQGIIVLSKCDLVDPEWLELIRADILQELQGTPFKDAPVFEVSAQTGQGIPELQEAIFSIARQLPQPQRSLPTRLPIDRTFELHGLGPVVTGSLHGNDLRVGEQIQVLPGPYQGRVRGLQVHHQPVQAAHHGQRTAVNLQGIPLDDLQRGQILTNELTLQPSREIAVSLRVLAHLPKPIKHRAPLLCHLGTQQIACRLWLPTQSHLAPDEHTFAYLLLEEETLALPQDHFILRGFERFPMHGSTVAGGVILDPFPPKRKRQRPEISARLQTLLLEDDEQRASLLVLESQQQTLEKSKLAQRLGIFGKPLEQLLQKLTSKSVIVQLDRDPPHYLHTQTLEQLCLEAQKILETYHKTHPLHEGMPREALREQLRSPSTRLFHLILQTLQKQGTIAPPQDLLRLDSHLVQLEGDHANLEERLISTYLEAALNPPRVQDLPQLVETSASTLKPILTLLFRNGTLVRVSDELYFHHTHLLDLQERLVQFLLQHQTLSPQDFKQLTQTSRKFTIPLAEYFDKQRITVRHGDSRKLRDPSAHQQTL